jgi:hypothetical protein
MAQALGFPLLAELKHRALSDSSAPALLAVRDTLLAGADDLLVGITSTDAVWSDKLAGTLAAAIQPLKRAEVLRLTGLGPEKLAKETEHLHSRHGQITLIGLPEALRPDLSPQLLGRMRCLLILLPEAGVDRAALQTLRTRFKELSIPVYVVILA